MWLRCMATSGWCSSNRGKLPEVLKMHEKALKTLVSVLGSEHQDTATAKNNIRVVLKKQGKYPKALEMHGKCLKAHEKVLGRNHPLGASTHNK